MSETSELYTLFPENETFLGYAIKKYKFRDFKAAIAIAQRNAALFSGDFVGALLSPQSMDDLTQFILFSVEISAEELEDLPLESVIQLTLKVFELNASFFIQAINQGAKGIAQALQGTGEKLPES